MHKILLVDDDLELTQLLTEILTLEGFDVTVAEDGEEGLLRLAEQAFDLVLLDPERIQDKATYENPRQMCEGIERVMVNGQWAFAHGKALGTGSGRFLRR